MPRPKAFKDLPLIPGEVIIDSKEFEKGFIGNIDSQGRIPTVGEEWRGREVIILIKKVPALEMRVQELEGEKEE